MIQQIANGLVVSAGRRLISSGAPLGSRWQFLEAVSKLRLAVAELARVLAFPVCAGSLATSATVLRLFLVTLAPCIAPTALRADDVHFARQIQPILADRCFACHGPDAAQRQAELRLDIADEATRPRESGNAAIVPGSAADSEMVRRIRSTDPDEVMPPPDTKNPLTQQDKELLIAWIQQGARFEKHWAYEPPLRPTPPDVALLAWQENPIDRFILTTMQSRGLQPAAEADRYTLVRRLHLVLTGLPPTIEQVDAFVADTRPDAYARLVDRLLGESAYGEHMARNWLDVARYADSNGYSLDASRQIWAWRDWVIDAFNRNMPFDEFTVEQIAGDLLPGATDSQMIATGFHRNTMFIEEGGIDPEEFRTKAVKDRVSTTMTAWMGATMMCCECHDHKYDPLTQKEFYQLYAFFNNVPETGGGQGQGEKPEPFFELPDSDYQQNKMEDLEKRLAAAVRRRDDARSRIAALITQWERDLESGPDPVVWHVLDPLEFTSHWGAELKKLDDLSILSSELRPEREHVTFIAETDLPRITAVKLELLPDPSLPAGGPGRFDSGQGVLTRLTAAAAPRSNPAATRVLTFSAATTDDTQPGLDLERLIDDSKTGWAVGGHPGRRQHAVLTVADQRSYEGGTRLQFDLHQELGLGYLLGRFRISVTDAPGPFTSDGPEVSSAVVPILAKPADQRSEAETQQLQDYFESEVLAHLNDAVSALTIARDDAKKNKPTTMVMGEREDPREAFVQPGGNFLDRGEAVEPAVPAVFHPLAVEGDRKPNRLDLAKWLIDPNNPLMARVTVNRLWQQAFGSGLVGTPEEFGTRGEFPSHPELLDWLATEFIRSGWDVKTMLRLIVNGTTFRQAASATQTALQRDAQNRYYARGPRFRLDGETIRDVALAVSGLLNRSIGGPSVFPYQVENLWLERNLGVWPTSTGDDLYRRSMYTYWRRAIPHPFFASFDGPTREFCVVRRARTNTPLQALATLNSKHFAEAARVFGERILKHDVSTDEERIDFAFRSCVARPPQQREADVLLQLLQDRQRYFRQHTEEAAKVIRIGAAPDATVGTAVDLAAWSIVANTLLNLDETLTRP